MHKKVLNLLSFIALFLLFGISIYCIFDGTTSVKADQANQANQANQTNQTKQVNKISKTNKKVKDEDKPEKVYVDIKGAINNPGVYEVDYGTRIIDVIKLAGDLNDQADTSLLNLSKKVKDEMYIIVYTKQEIQDFKEKSISNKSILKEAEKNCVCPDDDNDACLNKSSESFEGKININTASKEELESLPGIGPSKADAIIEYRNSNVFQSIEDIKLVNGIGDSLYEKIKDNIEI